MEWHKCVHDDEIELSSVVNSITLPNLGIIRKFANEAVLDIILYLTSSFKEKIAASVCMKINRVYALFCKNNPLFVEHGANCSLIGHSLGR